MNGEKCSFLKNVEGILQTDLQDENTFGCKINNCHTHAGSKVHFHDFVEAEILFHNNYYNHGFAYLTVNEIIQSISQMQRDIRHVYLVGYESYSELYLREVQQQFIQSEISENGEKISCDYFIYETLSNAESGHETYIGENSRHFEQQNDVDAIENDNIRGSVYDVYDRHQTNTGIGIKPKAIIRNLQTKDGKAFCYYGLPNSHNMIELPFPVEYNHCLFVYIVPINTTLSTMDKMVSLFERTCALAEKSREVSKRYICLITIGPNDGVPNIYWKKSNNNPLNGEYLEPKEGRFGTLMPCNSVITFAFTESTWTYAKANDTNNVAICKDCYPDRFNKQLTEEKPVFDVTRSSVVPMLQLGQKLPLKPIIVDSIKKTEIDRNLKRVWRISEFTSHHHIYRGNNHYQFYLDAPGFLNAYSNDPDGDISVSKYLEGIRDISKENNNTIVYNYIVAPSHKTNVAWVNMVYSKVFTNNSDDYRNEFNGARVLYFDVAKEYRSNFKAKYSDFVQSFSNILKHNSEYEIRFHFVDETITTGSRLLRAADLIHSLLSSIELDDNQRKRIKLFYSIYLLYGRSSSDSKRFYYQLFKEAGMKDAEEVLHRNVHEYVNIRISNLRNFKDACTLCKLTSDYRIIQNYCATNTMADVCSKVIYNHMPRKATALANVGEFCCDDEKRYMFLITHILNSRICLNNEPLFAEEKNKKEIDIESEKASIQIKGVLVDYYSNLQRWLTHILKGDFAENPDEAAFSNAFIKVISRPFFSFHLRKRQAAFEFCLEQIEDLCFNKKVETYNSIETLIKALADMNANYLIRQKKFSKLLSIAAGNYESALSFCHALKKAVTLSQDTTKSLLLEHILVNNQENGFFKGEYPEAHDFAFKNNNGLSLCGLIYLENNRIINDALNDIYMNPDLINGEGRSPYYLDNFRSILEINGIELNADFGKGYKELVDRITFEKELSSKSINDTINRIGTCISHQSQDELQIIPFVRNKRISMSEENYNKAFEFMLFSDDARNSEKKLFYHDDNLHKLHTLFRSVLDSNKTTDILFSKDVLFYDSIVVVRFLQNRNYNSDITGVDIDKALYIQINNFDCNCITHWFKLKVILSLRGTISNMIASINMPETIEKLFNGMLQSAMTDPKAQMHSKIETTMSLDFCRQDDEIEQNDNCDSYKKGIYAALKECNKNAEESEQVLSKVYFKCLSLMADEMLASWYRRLIRREKNPKEMVVGQNWPLDFANKDTNDTVAFWMKHLFNASVYTTSDKYLQISERNHLYLAGNFTYYCCVSSVFRKVNVKLIFQDKNEKLHDNLVLISFPTASVSMILRYSFFPILVLLVNNAVSHANADIVEVIFDIDNRCIRIENEIGYDVSDDEKRNVEECLNIIPFIRQGKKEELSINYKQEEKHSEGLTLWTLKHLTQDRNWFEAGYDLESKKFVVKLNNCIELEED